MGEIIPGDSNKLGNFVVGKQREVHLDIHDSQVIGTIPDRLKDLCPHSEIGMA